LDADSVIGIYDTVWGGSKKVFIGQADLPDDLHMPFIAEEKALAMATLINEEAT
jgi:hypothetical protein